jgi:hypothetical protein
MKWFMLVTGVLTCSMFYATVAPQAALQQTFGETTSGPVADVVVRNWGALIGLVGVGLIYGALDRAARRFALLLGAVSKAIFIAIVLIYGRAFLSRGAGVAIVVDAICVVVFAVFLMRAPRAINPAADDEAAR